MTIYITRRLIAAFFILIAASFLVYMLMTQAGDPLAFAINIQNPVQRQTIIRIVTETLSLDQAPIPRYWNWLTRLFLGSEDGRFGLDSRAQLPIWDDLLRRMPLTLKLVSAATVIAVVLGVMVGIVTALRQYSGFDYLVTFVTFVFFSLPVFWVAVILKTWGGVNFNDWLRDGAHFSIAFIVAAAVVAAVVGYSVAGGQWYRKAVFAVASGAVVAGLLSWISSHGWMLNPSVGPIVYGVLGLGIAVGVTAVMAGLGNARARTAALVTAAVGIASYFPVHSVLDDGLDPWQFLALLAAGTLAVVIVANLVGLGSGGPAAAIRELTGWLARGGGAVALLIAAAVGAATFFGVRAVVDSELHPLLIVLAVIAAVVAAVFVGRAVAHGAARSLTPLAAVLGVGAVVATAAVGDQANLWVVVTLAVAAVLVGAVVGYGMGGFDKGQSARTGALVAFLMSIVLFIDRSMQSWAEYSSTSVIRNRPIKTIGDRESRLEGSFWVITNDTFSHLVLPTLALMLISVAAYTRFSRASMLEVLNQDYIRTARAKGLTERTVVVRHAFRNALIPLATIVAFDISGIIGGAVITETVFEWDGMGSLFIDGLRDIDPNRVMAFFVITGLFAVVFNLIADVVYASLDPRIRIGE